MHIDKVAVERVATGFGFTEGPVWLPEGALLFSDIPNNRICRMAPDGAVTVWREPSGCDDRGSRSENRGSNGMTLDREGRLLVCEHGNRRVTRTEQDGSVTVIASHFEGKRLNSPNDIVVSSSGDIYFTDPPYGLDGREEDPAKELPNAGVYRLSPSGELRLLTAVLMRPNGIALSPAEDVLYVGNSEKSRKVWMRFQLKADGSLGEGTVLYDATSHEGTGSPDGFKLSPSGTLFCTGPGGVLILSPTGEHLGTVSVPEITANCAWGDADLQSLYVTASTSIYRIRGLPL
jgi:gluconolactonase